MCLRSREKQTTSLCLSFSLMLLAAAGCEDRTSQPTAAAPSRASAVKVSAPAPKTSSSAAIAMGPRPFELDEPIGFRLVERPSKVACALGTKDWRLKGGVAVLYPAVDAKSFASVSGGEARLMIVEGKDRIAGVLEAEDSGIFVRGLVLRGQDAPDGGAPEQLFPLHAARPLIFGACFIPKPATTLAWSEAAKGTLVAQPSSKGIVMDQGKLSQQLSCADVCPIVPSFDPRSALKVKTDALRRVSLGKAKELALATEPGGSPVARVRLGEGFGAEARVLEEKGKHTRILLESPSGFAFGWVESALLGTIPDDAPDFGLGGLGLSGIGFGGGGRGLLRPVEFICPHEVRLLIDQTATEGAIRQVHRYVVGGYRANTKIVASEPRGERTAVLPPAKDAKISFYFGQSVLIFSSELQKCRKVDAKPKSSAGAR